MRSSSCERTRIDAVAACRSGCMTMVCGAGIRVRPDSETALDGVNWWAAVAAAGSFAEIATGACSGTAAVAGTTRSIDTDLRSPSRVCSMASKRVNRGSKSSAAADSEPMYSISVSIRWAISPRRRAPASRALPLSVCNARNTSMRALLLSGRDDHCRKAPPNCGISSAASSSKIGNNSGSIASTASISSSLSTEKTSRAASARIGGLDSRGAVARLFGRGSGGATGICKTALTESTG